VGALTERVYRDGGFADDHYAEVLRDGPLTRSRDGIVLVAARRTGTITGTVTLALPGTPLAHLCRADEARGPDARGRRGSPRPGASPTAS